MQGAVEALTLLREIHWSSIGVEQAHGSLAVLKRFHPDYTMETLLTRAFVHQFRALFAAEAEDSQLEKYAKRHAKLSAKRPRKQRGQGQFFKAERRNLTQSMTAGKKLSEAEHHAFFGQTMRRWNNLRAHEKAMFTGKARQAAEKKRKRVHEDLSELKTRQGIEACRVKRQTLASDKQCLISNCKYATQDMEAMERIVKDQSALPKLEIAARRETSTTAPDKDESDLADLSKFPVPDLATTDEHPMPRVFVRLLWNRAYFRHCGLSLRNPVDSSEQLFYLHFAVQGTYHVALCPMVESPAKPRARNMAGSMMVLSSSRSLHNYELRWRETLSASNLQMGETTELWVLPCLRFDTVSHASSAAGWVTLDSFLAGRERLAPKPKQSKDTPKEDVRKAHFEANPLQATLLREQAERASRAASSSGFGGPKQQAAKTEEESSDTSSDDEPDPSGPMEEVASGHSWEGLQAKRMELDSKFTGAFEDFETHTRGGDDTEKRKGVAFDVIVGRAIPVHKAAQAWQKKYGLQASVSFSFKKYTEAVAVVLARAWVHRMQHFYNIYKVVGDPQMEYTAAHWSNYVEPDALVQLSESADVKPSVLERIFQIQAILPLLPRSAASSSKD